MASLKWLVYQMSSIAKELTELSTKGIAVTSNLTGVKNQPKKNRAKKSQNFTLKQIDSITFMLEN